MKLLWVFCHVMQSDFMTYSVETQRICQMEYLFVFCNVPTQIAYYAQKKNNIYVCDILYA